MTVMNLHELEVWARAKDFAVSVYKEVISCLPLDEKWNLAQQLRRAAQSIPANIAEGHGRYHFLDKVRFCYIARGSLTEIQSHLTLTQDLGFLAPETYKRLAADAESLGRQLNNYIASLKRAKQGEKEFPASYTVEEESVPYMLETPHKETED